MKKYVLLICMFVIMFLSSSIRNVKAVSASSAILMEMNSGRIMYEQNIHERHLTASIAKIMTALVAVENGYLNEYIEISREATQQIGSSLYLEQGDKVVLLDLVYGLLLRSGNDAAYAIAESVGNDVDHFIYLMNETAKKIGMKNSTFENPAGLDEKTKNYSTAYDMALLTKYAYQNEIFRKVFSTKVHRCETKNGNHYVWMNKHRLLKNYDYVTGGKTGFTKAASRTLVTTANLGNMDLVVVTFRDGNDWNDHKYLFNYAVENFTMTKIIYKGVINLGEYSIGEPVIINHDVYYPINNTTEEIRMVVKLLKEYDDNQRNIGKVELYNGEEKIYECNLYRVITEDSEDVVFRFFRKIRDIIW